MRGSAFLGIAWDELGATRNRAASRATLVRNDDHEITSTWWRRGTSGEIHGLGESEASIVVLEGEIAVERWIRGDEGEWRYSRIALRQGGSIDVPRGGLQRIAALRDSTVITTCAPPVAHVAPIERAMSAVLDLASQGVLGASETTALGLPVPTTSTEEGDA